MSAVRYGKRIDLQGNQILNAIQHSSNGLPGATAAMAGHLRYNTATNRIYVCTGTSWELKATDSDLLNGQNGSYYNDLGNSTGSITSGKVSDFSTAVNNRRITDLTVAPNKDLALGNNKITGLANGVSSNDAINVGQLDQVRQIALSAASGTAIKAPVLAVALTNQDLLNIGSIDGVSIPINGRFLLAGQTDSTQNGIYYKNSGNAAVRATDADETGELSPGTQVFVTQGSANGDSSFAIISDVPITIGTTAQSWAKVPGSSGSNYTWGNGLQNSAGTVSVKPGTGINVSDGNVNVDTSVVVRKFLYNVPATSGTNGIVTITHNLNTRDVIVQLRDVSAGSAAGTAQDVILVGVTVTDVNTVQLDFDVTSIPANTYRVTIIG